MTTLKDLVQLANHHAFTDESTITVDCIQRRIVRNRYDKQAVTIYFDTFSVGILFKKTINICVFLLKNSNVQLYLDRGIIHPRKSNPRKVSFLINRRNKKIFNS